MGRRVLVITTGGTIGALPYPDPRQHPRYAVFPRQCPVRRALAFRNMGLAWRACDWCALPPRDSQRIDAAYRRHLQRVIGQHAGRRVLVTHGTDAMLATAAGLRRDRTLRQKTIILVGAMLPLTNGADSDGWQNLRYALRRLVRHGRWSPGIYLVLSDYDGPRRDWRPRLYRFMPGVLEKYYDPERADRSRLIVHDRRALLRG